MVSWGTIDRDAIIFFFFFVSIWSLLLLLSSFSLFSSLRNPPRLRISTKNSGVLSIKEASWGRWAVSPLTVWFFLILIWTVRWSLHPTVDNWCLIFMWPFRVEYLGQWICEKSFLHRPTGPLSDCGLLCIELNLRAYWQLHCLNVWFASFPHLPQVTKGLM